MAKLIFEHENPAVGKLTIETGMDAISWSYNLNTAQFPTYSGEVIQILSIYVDDVNLEGTLKSYDEMEAVYTYFAKYINIASQGLEGKGSYEQVPMKMFYAPRNWTFTIQPLSIPGFMYSKETVTPTWKMTAHVVDTTSGNYKELEQMIETHILNNEEFNYKGVVSPAAANPELNPWSAPGNFVNGKFVPAGASQTKEVTKEVADWYNTLLPAYISGDYTSLTTGSKPIFGQIKSEELGLTQAGETKNG